jgi:ribosomal protein L21E
MPQVIKQHLLRTQVRMKHQADKQRSEVSYEVGDKVYLKLQPYVQTSLANRTHQKLAFKFLGPYVITDKVGAVAYKLHLPGGSLVYPVFHASQLKKCVSPLS